MLTRNRKIIPQMFLESLEKDTCALKAFMSMNDTHQKLYITQVKDPKFGDSMRERVERAIQDIHKYAAANSITR